MFTIEHTFDATVITLVDDPAVHREEDITVTAFEDVVTLEQLDPRTDRVQKITFSESQLRDLMAALDLPGSLRDSCAWAGLEPQELAARTGVGEAAARRLAAALELGRRACAHVPKRRTPLGGGRDVQQVLAPHLAGLRVEAFHALYLDAKGGLLEWRRISEGTLTASLVHPREVYAPALALRAAALVVAHNHPSGDPEPSAEDRATTRRLQRAGRLLGVELLDHVVIAGDAYVSFLEQGGL